jgi:hypothetical protein
VADANADAGSRATPPDAAAPERQREPLLSAEALAGITRSLGWLLAIGGAGLVVTGVPLIFVYRPHAVDWLRGAHGVASALFIGAAAGVVTVLMVAFARRLRVRPGWFVGLATLLVALIGLVSGQLLAWDGMAFESAGVFDPRGVVDGLSGDVRFVIVDGTEVSRGAYAAWAGVHVLLVPALALGVARIARRREP